MSLAFMQLAFRRFGRPPKQRTYALAAALIFAAAAAFELARIIAGVPWRNVPALPSNVIGAVLVTVWSSAALALVLRDRRPAALTLSWVLALAGTLAFLLHGAVTRVYGSLPGLLYIGLAIVQATLLKSSFDRGFLQTGTDAGGLATR